ncbi:MAG: hypothetical protein SGILL_005559 [Bacillariaceae sp.]
MSGKQSVREICLEQVEKGQPHRLLAVPPSDCDTNKHYIGNGENNTKFQLVGQSLSRTWSYGQRHQKPRPLKLKKGDAIQNLDTFGESEAWAMAILNERARAGQAFTRNNIKARLLERQQLLVGTKYGAFSTVYQDLHLDVFGNQGGRLQKSTFDQARGSTKYWTPFVAIFHHYTAEELKQKGLSNPKFKQLLYAKWLVLCKEMVSQGPSLPVIMERTKGFLEFLEDHVLVNKSVMKLNVQGYGTLQDYKVFLDYDGIVLPDDVKVPKGIGGSHQAGKIDEYAQDGFKFRHCITNAVMTKFLGTTLMEAYFDRKFLQMQYTALRGKTAEEEQCGNEEYPLYPTEYVVQGGFRRMILNHWDCRGDLQMNSLTGEIERESRSAMDSYFYQLLCTGTASSPSAVAAAATSEQAVPRAPTNTKSVARLSIASTTAPKAPMPRPKNPKKIAPSTRARDAGVSGMDGLYADALDSCKLLASAFADVTTEYRQDCDSRESAFSDLMLPLAKISSENARRLVVLGQMFASNAAVREEYGDDLAFFEAQFQQLELLASRGRIKSLTGNAAQVSSPSNKSLASQTRATAQTASPSNNSLQSQAFAVVQPSSPSNKSVQTQALMAARLFSPSNSSFTEKRRAALFSVSRSTNDRNSVRTKLLNGRKDLEALKSLHQRADERPPAPIEIKELVWPEAGHEKFGNIRLKLTSLHPTTYAFISGLKYRMQPHIGTETDRAFVGKCLRAVKRDLHRQHFCRGNKQAVIRDRDVNERIHAFIDEIELPKTPEQMALAGCLLDMSYFRNQKVLGMGGEGIVFQGYAGDPNRRVAIKNEVMDPDGVARFQQPVVEGGKPDHPGVADYIAYFIVEALSEDKATTALVQECGDHTLYDDIYRLHRERYEAQTHSNYDKLNELLEWVWEVFVHLFGAVSAMNAIHVIHRDIKATNIVSFDGRDFDSISIVQQTIHLIKIIDFGMAKIVPEKSTDLTTGCGTYAFKPPTLGNVALNHDVWSMMQTLYHFLVGDYADYTVNPQCHDENTVLAELRKYWDGADDEILKAFALLISDLAKHNGIELDNDAATALQKIMNMADCFNRRA